MSARDKIHLPVKNALVKDGWTITHDPYTLRYEEVTVQVDLAAERLLAAERGEEKIAIEIKGFRGLSPVHDMEEALGQYQIYATFMEDLAPTRKLYLAIPDFVYSDLFSQKAFQRIMRRNALNLVTVNLESEEVVEWIES